jgi:hypothetical protein
MLLPVTVAAPSTAWTVFARLGPGIVGSNPTQGMDVHGCFVVCNRLLCVCVVLCLGSGLATGLSFVQGAISSVKIIAELNKRPGPWMGWKSHWKKVLACTLFRQSHRHLFGILHETCVYVNIPKWFRNKYFDIYRRGAKSCFSAYCS